MTTTSTIYPDLEAVVEHYHTKPYGFEGVDIPDKGDILWIVCDVTQDGQEDIIISGSNMLTGDWDWLVWDVYKGESSGGYRLLMYGMIFSPENVLLVSDERGVSHLATIRPVSRSEQVVTALELDNDKTISSVGFRVLSMDSEADRAWLERQRNSAVGMVRRIPASELTKEDEPDTPVDDSGATGTSEQAPAAGIPQIAEATPSGASGKDEKDDPELESRSAEQADEISADSGPAPSSTGHDSWGELAVALLAVLAMVAGGIAYQKKPR